jgi:hypothetical protein
MWSGPRVDELLFLTRASLIIIFEILVASYMLCMGSSLRMERFATLLLHDINWFKRVLATFNGSVVIYPILESRSAILEVVFWSLVYSTVFHSLLSAMHSSCPL